MTTMDPPLRQRRNASPQRVALRQSVALAGKSIGAATADARTCSINGRDNVRTPQISAPHTMGTDFGGAPNHVEGR